MKKLSLIMTAMALAVSVKEKALHISEPMDNEEPRFTVVDEVEDPLTYVEPELISLGEFKLTAYCSCSICCGRWAHNRPVDEYGNEIVIGSSGQTLTAGYSIAVDPTIIPYGTVIVIDGKEYEAQDCGGAIKDKRIDVYFDSHEEALEFGVQYAEVFVKEDGLLNA